MSDDVAQLSEAMVIMRKKDVQHLVNRINELEAKLAKAVETISLCRKMQAQFTHTEDPLMVLLYTTIAELKGQNDE